jgi:hypothetical protein
MSQGAQASQGWPPFPAKLRASRGPGKEVTWDDMVSSGTYSAGNSAMAAETSVLLGSGSGSAPDRSR